MENLSLDFLTNILLAYAAMLIAIGFLLLIPKHIRRQNDLKRLEFTQRVIEQNKEVKKMTAKIFAVNETIKHNSEYLEYLEYHEKFSEKNHYTMPNDEIYSLLNFFNTLAYGIDRGIYDENLIRVNYEQDIKLFYQFSRPYFRNFISSHTDEMFLRIEYLIREWNGNKIKKKVTNFG